MSGPVHVPGMAGTVRPAAEGQVRAWPVALLALPAFVAIWSGWVGLGGLTGFGKVNPLPGTPLADWTLDTAITLPIGMEIYAAFALRVWLAGHLAPRATRFAKWSAIGSLLLGAAGQVAYHLMTAAGLTSAPWPITTIVACLPVAVLGMGAALAHLIHDTTPPAAPDTPATARPAVEPPAVPDVDEVDEVDEDVPAPTPAPRVANPVAQPQRAATKTTGAKTAGAKTAGAKTAGAKTAGAKTAATVARLRAAHPEWSAAQIAKRAGVTDRTVRRYLNASETPAARSNPANTDQTTSADLTNPVTEQEAA